MPGVDEGTLEVWIAARQLPLISHAGVVLTANISREALHPQVTAEPFLAHNGVMAKTVQNALNVTDSCCADFKDPDR